MIKMIRTENPDNRYINLQIELSMDDGATLDEVVEMAEVFIRSLGYHIDGHLEYRTAEDVMQEETLQEKVRILQERLEMLQISQGKAVCHNISCDDNCGTGGRDNE